MRHTEITEAPREIGRDSKRVIGNFLSRFKVMHGIKADKSRQRLNIINNLIPAARAAYSEEKHDNKRDCHNDTLYEVGC